MMGGVRRQLTADRRSGPRTTDDGRRASRAWSRWSAARGPWSLVLLAALAASACAAMPPVEREGPVEGPPARQEGTGGGDGSTVGAAPDSLASRLLSAAFEEARQSIEAYESVIEAAEEDRPDAQNRARQRVLTAALAAERGETLMRIRFAMLGGPPSEDEGQLRIYLSFLATGADDLLEADAIDPAALRTFLPDLTDPLREILALLDPDE